MFSVSARGGNARLGERSSLNSGIAARFRLCPNRDRLQAKPATQHLQRRTAAEQQRPDLVEVLGNVCLGPANRLLFCKCDSIAGETLLKPSAI